MKLRYHFYLLCFLICIQSYFCYEFIHEKHPNRRIPSKLTRKVGRLKQRRLKAHPRTRRQGNRDEPIADLDLSSFIQPQEYSYPGADTNDELEKSDYNDYENPSDFQVSLAGKSEDPIPEKMGALYNRNEKDTQLGNLESYSTSNIQGKKSPKARNMFMFFSHDKKGKKKKKHQFRHSNKAITTSNVDSKDNRNKRSFKSICPVCKRKLPAVTKKESSRPKGRTKMIHNSRQFYQGFGNFAKYKQKKGANPDVSKIQTYQRKKRVLGSRKQSRKTRQTDKDRQLHELEEVQRKIDNVRIPGVKTTPQMPAPTDMSDDYIIAAKENSLRHNM